MEKRLYTQALRKYEEILAYRKDDYQWNVLVADKGKARRKYKNAVVDDATIDDILLLYVKGEQAR